MMILNPKVKNALLKIDFISRYEKLSSHFNADRTPTENRLIYIDGNEVMEIIRNGERYAEYTKNKRCIGICSPMGV